MDQPPEQQRAPQQPAEQQPAHYIDFKNKIFTNKNNKSSNKRD